MAWSEEEAIQTGELLCIIDMSPVFSKGKYYKVITSSGRYKIISDIGLPLSVEIICKHNERYFKIDRQKLEND